MAPFKGVNDRGVAGFMVLKQRIGRECLLDFYQHCDIVSRPQLVTVPPNETQNQRPLLHEQGSP
jgi:hypothetical protein